MQRLFYTLVFCCTCSQLNASERSDSIYKLDAFNVSAPAAVVDPLVPFPEQQTAETTRERTEVDASLLFQAQSAPLLPFYESYDASQFYDQMRYWGGGLHCVIPKKPQEETKLAAADGAFTISRKLEEVWERMKSEYQESEEMYRLLNLYFEARHVDRP